MHIDDLAPYVERIVAVIGQQEWMRDAALARQHTGLFGELTGLREILYRPDYESRDEHGA